MKMMNKNANLFTSSSAVHTAITTVARLINELRTNNKSSKNQCKELTQMVFALKQETDTLLSSKNGRKNSTNSHLPPSSGRFIPKRASPRQRSDKKLGSQLDHKGTTLRRVGERDYRGIHSVTGCQGCGASLGDV